MTESEKVERHWLSEYIKLLDELQIKNQNSAFWWCLHQVVWHKAIDRVRWASSNKELVKEIALLSDTQFLFENPDLKERFWQSVFDLKTIDR